VAVSIFFVGAVFSIYKGVDKILHPEQIHSYTLSIVVLLGAMVFEAYAFMVAYKEASKFTTKKGLFGFIDMAVRTKNPTVMVVLFEDSAALTGLTIALIGMGLSYYTGNLLIDGITSVAIGVLLLGVAVLLARETKELLIGESATAEDIEAMRRALVSIPEIHKAGRLMTMHMGPDEILVNLDVEFVDGLSTDGVEAAVDKIERRLKQAVPAVKKIYIEAESLSAVSAVKASR
jgi:cation diffusion facilitator family transporter